MTEHKPATTVIGMGGMGRAIAETLQAAGHTTTVWNRTPGRAGGLTEAETAAEAIEAGAVTIVTLLTYDTVRAVLEPITGRLRGKTIVNLTSGTPAEARDMAAWAAEHGIDYLDGGMMAVPPMIGKPGAEILYSGPTPLFQELRPVLDHLAESTYLGEDAGLASLVDLAMLSGMYAMFAGLLHGTALAATAGIPAAEFMPRATAWAAAMAQYATGHAPAIDSGDYHAEEQNVTFNKSAVDLIHRASRDQGLDTLVIEPVKALLDRRQADGFGADSFESIIEGIKARSKK
ncbi:NAD(P)-dependent oxidoreductase [Phytomonospora endophytica]|uniref:3-hydroxyisobutyrate dehydrogenase-like beta-hydroxyacid dehydrogenase n=1 Tax=Phytomonospora endophytica TaxID=714109 RepID=A0A841FNE6_9ACTN|nr:NAD(P)-binding domain-containing protein [Phytomonospora endophytica]MBB6037575.1 3-hydroxyisobutyrate dehydrogenase-like beta-hydroxyacid dehydrogenase [Phytomonospora endophytica]GIG67899.1 oxidoreductase [Phytomonospora endophytica]